MDYTTEEYYVYGEIDPTKVLKTAIPEIVDYLDNIEVGNELYYQLQGNLSLSL